jgi:hypothetical protein
MILKKKMELFKYKTNQHKERIDVFTKKILIEFKNKND